MRVSRRAVFLCMVGVAVAAAPANANLIFHDGFSYPAGGLNAGSSGAWVTEGGDSGTPIQVVAGNLFYGPLIVPTGSQLQFSGAASSGVDSRRGLGGDINTGSVFYAFLLNVPNLGGSFSAGYLFRNKNFSGGSFRNGIRYQLDSDTSKYDLVLTGDTGTAARVTSPALTPGNIYFIVYEYRFNAGVNDDVVNLWINPASLGGAAPATSLTNTVLTDNTNIGSLALFTNSLAATPAQVNFDELRVGTTYADVTPVPEPATFCLLGIGAFTFIRRRTNRRHAR